MTPGDGDSPTAKRVREALRAYGRLSNAKAVARMAQEAGVGMSGGNLAKWASGLVKPGDPVLVAAFERAFAYDADHPGGLHPGELASIAQVEAIPPDEPLGAPSPPSSWGDVEAAGQTRRDVEQLKAQVEDLTARVNALEEGAAARLGRARERADRLREGR